MNEMENSLCAQVIRVTEEYLGPAAERFVTRHIHAHLGKPPSELTPEDLGPYIEWSKITLGLITDDHQLVDEYQHKIQELAKVKS